MGGSGRGAGKTAVGCALVKAFAGFGWTVVKVAGHGLVGELEEETDSTSEKDTGRYLAAGARRAFLAEGRSLGDFVWDGALLVESGQPVDELLGRAIVGLFVAVVGHPRSAWKTSLLERIGAADLVVLANGIRVGDLPVEVRERAVELDAGRWWSRELEERISLRLGA
jgi:hypothetical protein